MVLVHGLAESIGMWDRMLPALVDRFRIVRIDLLGFGASDKPRSGYGIDEQARRVERVISVADIAPVDVIGHSMGGDVAVALAERAPELVRKLVLIDPPPTRESRIHRPTERLMGVPVAGAVAWRLSPVSALRRGLESAFAPGFPVPDEFVADARRTTHAAFVGATSAVDDYLAARPLAARVASTGKPTLVIYGELDERIAVVGRRTFDGLANVTVKTLPGVGHTPPWEQPETTATLIAQFADATR
jgi:pimeloyl-ACP methyl ester carboxylesterase